LTAAASISALVTLVRKTSLDLQVTIVSHWAFCGPEVSPASAAPAAALSSELVGTWSASSARPETLVLGSCAVGEECGRFGRFDGAEDCVYPLEYRSRTGDEFKFRSTDANSFGCAWSPWAIADLYVRLGPDGPVVIRNPAGLSFTLH
jgi:hypothetical protein